LGLVIQQGPIMQLTKILFVFLLLFAGSFVSADYYSIGYTATNEQMLTSGGTQTWNVRCPAGTTLTEIRNVWIDAISANANIDFYLDSNLVYSTTSVPTAGSGRAYTIPLNFTCTGSVVNLEFDSTNATTFQVRANGYNSGEEYYNSPVSITVPTSPYKNLVGTIVYTPASSNVTTYVPVNQYVTNLSCVNGTPTTTCSFTYSTTTATSTYDYRPYFDYITLFIGLLFFALGVYMFRSLAIKYLK